jgi:hypothetical protein
MPTTQAPGAQRPPGLTAIDLLRILADTPDVPGARR